MMGCSFKENIQALNVELLCLFFPFPVPLPYLLNTKHFGGIRTSVNTYWDCELVGEGEMNQTPFHAPRVHRPLQHPHKSECRRDACWCCPQSCPSWEWAWRCMGWRSLGSSSNRGNLIGRRAWVWDKAPYQTLSYKEKMPRPGLRERIQKVWACPCCSLWALHLWVHLIGCKCICWRTCDTPSCM